jgi:hypothetical protein
MKEQYNDEMTQKYLYDIILPPCSASLLTGTMSHGVVLGTATCCSGGTDLDLFSGQLHGSKVSFVIAKEMT